MPGTPCIPAIITAICSTLAPAHILDVPDSAAVRSLPKTLRMLELYEWGDNIEGDELDAWRIYEPPWLHIARGMHTLELVRLESFPAIMFSEGMPSKLQMLQLKNPILPPAAERHLVREAFKRFGPRRTHVALTNRSRAKRAKDAAFWRSIERTIVTVVCDQDFVLAAFPCWWGSFRYGPPCDCPRCS